MPNFAFCAFYDDVRAEISGKTSYIGRYHRDMIVQSFPLDIDQLWIDLTYSTDVKKPDLPSLITVEIPGAERPIECKFEEFTPPPSDNKDKSVTKLNLSLSFPLGAVKVEREGEIKASLTTQGGEKITAGRLIVRKKSKDISGELDPKSIEVIKAYFSYVSKNKNEISNDAASVILEAITRNTPSPEIKSPTDFRMRISETRCLVLLSEEIPENYTISLDPPSPAHVENQTKFSFEVVFETPTNSPEKFNFHLETQDPQ